MAIRALSTAASGMTTLQSNIDIIANNLANVNTTGYKRQRGEFQDLLYQQLIQPGFAAASPDSVNPTGIQVGHGVKLVGTNRVFEQGALNNTGRELDWAVDGQGFFQVLLADGQTIGYTRDGSFHRDVQGNIVTSQGLRLRDQLQVPEEVINVSISQTGLVQGLDPTNPNAPVAIGQITLARFSNPAGLRSIGDNLFVTTPAAGQGGAPVEEANPGSGGLGVTRDRFLEASNVEVVQELVEMITTQRAFEINATSIRTADEMLQTVNNLRR